MEDIEGLELAILDKEEEAMEREEDRDDATEGIGDLGRGRRKRRRSGRRKHTKVGRNRKGSSV